MLMDICGRVNHDASGKRTECLEVGDHFCVPRADHVCQFFEELLVHTKGTHYRKPFLLRDWQKDILRPLFGTTVWSVEQKAYARKYRIAYIELARKNGKALSVSTPILTADGWRKMGNISVGDYVHAPDGSMTKVLAVSPIWTDTDCYGVRFADGAELVVSGQHLWTVNDRRLGYARIIDTVELAETLHYGARGDRRYSVDVPAPLDRATVDLPLDPYLLGVWLGDGTSDQASITSADHEVFAAVERAGFRFGRTNAIRGRARTKSILGLLPILRDMCVLKNKHIPDRYLTASFDQRMSVLRGLMDTDGSVIVGPNTPRVEFCNTNRKLADDVLFLARSLGWKATIKESVARLNGKDCGLRYRVSWTAYRELSPFSLHRKTCLLHSKPDSPTRVRTNVIVSVERVPTVDTVCIQVAHPTGMFLAGESLTPTHNSQLLAGIMLYLLFADGEYSGEIYSVAKDRTQATAVFDVAAQMVLNQPLLSRNARVVASTKRIVVAKTNSVYSVKAADAGRILGLNPSGVAADEILAWPKRDVWDAFRSGMGSMDRLQPLMVAATTAPGDDDTFGADMHREMIRVLEDPDRAPHVFAWVRNLPLDADIYDEENWKIPNPALGDFLSLEEMRRMSVEAKNNPIAELSFRRFQLNQTLGSEIHWLPVFLWDACEGERFGNADQTMAAFEGRECWMGVDLAGRVDLTSVAYFFPDDTGEGGSLVWRHWMPREAYEKLNRSNGGRLYEYVRDGWLTVTEGNVLDFNSVYDAIDLDAQRYTVLGLDADRWSSDPVLQEIAYRAYITEDQMMAYSNDFQHMSDSMHRMYEMVITHKLKHHGNPLARWCVDCCDAKLHPTDPDLIMPLKPDRNQSNIRIDSVPAAIMALKAWWERGHNQVSVYENNDLMVL